MGSSYFGEPNLGNERASGSSSSSSRKGKKNNSYKPKQPQRGLGVAQLEKIRLHGQMACGYHHPSMHTPYPSNLNNEDPGVQIAYSSVPSSSFSYSSSSTSCTASYGFQPHIMMGLPECEKTSVKYGDSQLTHTPRWDHANAILENQSSAQSNITRPFLKLYDSQDIDIKNRSGSLGLSSQNFESSDTQELDLELRLSR